jgi:hypothetical protein
MRRFGDNLVVDAAGGISLMRVGGCDENSLMRQG